MDINYIFLRHGHGCHNAIRPLKKRNIISNDTAYKLVYEEDPNLKDPELTEIGVDASIYNGCVVSKYIRALKNFPIEKRFDISTIHVVGCSPLIRCMETSYYMTRKWKNPPEKIYVFPFLREIDESSTNKYSKESLETIDREPSYAMKTIQEQKEYLLSEGILDFFDFSFVERYQNDRQQPGDIQNFVTFFVQKFVSKIKPMRQLNVYITTHAGVLKDFAKEGFHNNTGFVLNTSVQNPIIAYGKKLSLNSIPEFKKEIFYAYDTDITATPEYYCPSTRCGQLCKYVKNPTGKLESFPFPKCQNSEGENL